MTMLAFRMSSDRYSPSMLPGTTVREHFRPRSTASVALPGKDSDSAMPMTRVNGASKRTHLRLIVNSSIPVPRLFFPAFSFLSFYDSYP